MKRWIYAFLLLLITGCTSASPVIDAPFMDDTPTQEVVLTDTIVPLPSNTSLPLSTNTPEPTSTQTLTPTKLPTATRTPTIEPLEVVKVMQYNIFYGGGYAKGWCLESRESHHPPKGYFFGDNSELITQIILTAEPDILVLNETCGFNNSYIAQNFSEAVGMPSYFIAEDYFDGAVPTSIYVNDGYKIVNKKSLKYSEGKTKADIFRGLYALVETPKGNLVNIYGVHLCPFPDGDPIYAIQQAEWITGLMEQHKNENIILMGDMNINGYNLTRPVYSQIGLKGLGQRGIVNRWEVQSWATRDPEYFTIDQIWVSSNLKFLAYSQSREYYDSLESVSELFLTASDHNPEAAVIAIYPP
jgi:hypothetical protein